MAPNGLIVQQHKSAFQARFKGFGMRSNKYEEEEMGRKIENPKRWMNGWMTHLFPQERKKERPFFSRDASSDALSCLVELDRCNMSWDEEGSRDRMREKLVIAPHRSYFPQRMLLVQEVHVSLHSSIDWVWGSS